MQGARHLLNDEDEDIQHPLIPDIQVNLGPDEEINRIVIVPETIALLVSRAPHTTIGNLTVTYPQNDFQVDYTSTGNDFDEDEQLYTAVDTQAFLRKYPSTVIPIYRVDGTQTVAIIIPHFVNTIAERLVAKKLVLLLGSKSQALTLSPCQINNYLTISRLDMSPQLFQEVPILQPPHVVTGISAAFVSEFTKVYHNIARLGALVLNSEGQPGFEKIDADAIIDAAEQSANFIVGAKNKDEYLKSLSQTVRKVNSAVTSGMYL